MRTKTLQQRVLHGRVVQRLRSELAVAELPSCAPPAADAAAALAVHLPAAELAPLAGALLPTSTAAPAAGALRPTWALALGLRLAEAMLARSRGAGLGSGSGLAAAEDALTADAEPGPAEQHGVIAGVVGLLAGSAVGPEPARPARSHSPGSTAMADGQQGVWQSRESVQEAAEGCVLLALDCTKRGWRQGMYGHLTGFHALI